MVCWCCVASYVGDDDWLLVGDCLVDDWSSMLVIDEWLVCGW